MNLDNYAKHLAFKYMSAAAIAVINKKPKDVSLEDFVKQLQSNIQNDKVGDEYIDVTVCSDDFILDLDSTDNHGMNDDNNYTEVNNDESIMGCTITKGNMEVTAEFAETETFNYKKYYAEVPNDQLTKEYTPRRDRKATETLNKTNMKVTAKLADKVEDECIDLTVCNDDFILVLDSTDSDKMNDDKKYTEVANNSQSVMDCTMIDNNMEVTAKLETLNCKNNFAEVITKNQEETKTNYYKNKYATANNQSNKKSMKKFGATETKTLNKKNNYAKVANDQSIMEFTIRKDMEETKKVDETNIYNYKNEYANYLAFKYMSAAAIAVINKKPKDVPLEDFVKQLQTSLQNNKVEDECIDLTVCSDDFILDLDSTDNDKMNYDNNYTEVANDQSIMKCTIIEKNIEGTTKLAVTEKNNCNNYYAEVANDKSIMKCTVTEDTKATKKLNETNNFNHINKYRNDQSNKECTKNIEEILTETEPFNYKKICVEVAVDESIKESAKKIEATEKQEEPRTLNYKNKYAEVANNKSSKKSTKNVGATEKLTKTKIFNYKYSYAKIANNQSINKCPNDMAESENLTDTATFQFSEFNTPVQTVTKTQSKKQRKPKKEKSVKRKYIEVTNVQTPKPSQTEIQLDSQATELYEVPSTQMFDSHISQTQEEKDKRFAILDKYVLGMPKKKVPKLVEPIKVVEVKRYENRQSPNIFDSQQECGQDFDMYNDEVIPSINNVEHTKPVSFSNNKCPEISECKNYTQDFVKDIHNETQYTVNDNTKTYCRPHNAIEIEKDLRLETIFPNTNIKKTAHKWTPATEYLEIRSQNNEIILNKRSQINIENKTVLSNNNMTRKTNNDKQTIKNNEDIINLDDTYSDIINNVQNYLNKHDINNLQENMESQHQTQLLDISNNRKDVNAENIFNSQNQFTNMSQINFDKNEMSSNLDDLANVSSYIDSNLNFNAIILENNQIRNDIQDSQNPYLEYNGRINNLDTNEFKPIENVYSQDMELDDIEIGNKIFDEKGKKQYLEYRNKITDQKSQKQYLEYKGSIKNLDTNKFKQIENVYSQDIELEDGIQIRNKISDQKSQKGNKNNLDTNKFKPIEIVYSQEIENEITYQNNIQNSQKPHIEYKGRINNLDTNKFKPIENSQNFHLENDIEIRNKITDQKIQKQYMQYKGSINNHDINKLKPVENVYSQEIQIEDEITYQNNIQNIQKQYLEYKGSKPVENFCSQDILDDIEITNTENSIPFKIIMELNAVKSWLNKSNRISSGGYGTDSGYRSDNQKKIFLTNEKNLNQTAISLLSFVTTQPLSTSTFTVVQEISQVLGELIDVLHNEEKYPQFLDKILENVDCLLQDIWNGDSCGDAVISIKTDLTTRMVLLNQSLHINEYTIEKIDNILEEFQTKITKTDDLYEISNTSHMENLTNIFHILEIILKIYLKGKNINISTQKTQLSNEESVFKKSSIVDIWKRKWDPNYKKDDVESGTAEKACVTIKCREVLKKIIVDCMPGYSLVSFAALQCFNYLQK